VALLIANSVDFIVAALASLWCGAVFVPLAVGDPMTRLRTIVDDLEPKIVVVASTNDTEPLVDFADVEVTTLDELRAEGPVPEYSRDTSLVAYMIYTSGTTGKPKGFRLATRPLVPPYVRSADALGLNQRTRTLLVSPFHFDGSYANLFPTLVSGGTVVMRPREALLFPRTFFNAIQMKTSRTPASLRATYGYCLLVRSSHDFVTHARDRGARRRGDQRRRLAIALVKGAALRVFNRYGPTETTIAVTNVELTPAMIESGTVTIGRPHPASRSYWSTMTEPS